MHHLAEHDELLGRTLTTRATSNTRAQVMAVLTRATSHDIDPTVTRAWLMSRGSPAVRTLAKSPTWTELVSATTQFASSRSASDPIPAARRVVGWVLAAEPHRVRDGGRVTTTAEIQGRVTTLLVGLRILAGTWHDTCRYDRVTLAAELNIGRATARAWLRTAADSNGVVIRADRSGQPPILALRPLPKTVSARLGDDLTETFRALGEGRTDDILAVALRSAHNPLWSYDAYPTRDRDGATVTGPEMLLAFLGLAAHGDVAALGVSRRKRKACTAWLTERGLFGALAQGPEALQAVLDQFGTEGDAARLRAEAMAVREAKREARRESVRADRERKAAARARLAIEKRRAKRKAGSLGSLPDRLASLTPDQFKADRNGWATSVRRAVTASKVDPTTARDVLVEMLVLDWGIKPEQATTLAERVVPAG